MKTNEQIAGECAWCGGALNKTVHGVGASDSEPVRTGEVFVEVSFMRSNRSLFAARIQPGSRAYGEGYRLIFASCSDACARRLGEVLANENGRFAKCAMLKPEE
ncbi:MAG: hypothetical protein HY349_07915 [Nitrospirae bacterium]|nr:hypothetical protein [Nitrospirota bacterium]